MHSFVYGILGGALIGLSASTLLLFAGEILGASGIINSIVLTPQTSFLNPCSHWKFVLVASFALTANLFYSDLYSDKDDALTGISPLAFVIGGFFVGFGTKLGNGCTSGHGICGLARFSKRSFAAVCSFMVTGIITAYLTQYETTPFPKEVFEFLRSDKDNEIEIWNEAATVIVFFLGLTAFVAPAFHSDPSPNCRTKVPPAAIAGVLFSVGLYVSRMVFPKYVLGFLNVGLLERGGDNWDPTLMFVMGGGATISFLSYQAVEGYNVLKIFKPISKPLALTDGSDFCVPNNTAIDKDLIIGAVCFGIGWGITGLCPGPAMFLASIGVSWVLVCYWPAFFVGSFLASHLKGRSMCTTQSDQASPSEQGDAGPDGSSKEAGSTHVFDVESGSNTGSA